MRIVIVVLLVGFSLNVWSAKPGSGRRTQRASEVFSKTEIFKDFNTRVSSILYVDIQLRVPDQMTLSEARALKTGADSLVESIQMASKQPSFYDAKRGDIVTILESMNMGFATRSNLVEFINKNEGTNDLNLKGVLAKANELVGIIDNSFNILKSRVDDNSVFPVNARKITLVLSSFGRVNREYTARMVMELVREIQSIIDNPQISLRKIALCR